MSVKDYVKPWVPGLGKYVPGEYRDGYTKLASNENNYGPSPKVVEAVKSAMEKSHVYPYLDDEVKKKCAEYVGVDEDCVVTGNGSDELMELALKTFQGNAAGFYPAYASYKLFSEMFGVDFREVNLNEDFSFNVDEFIRKTRNNRICFIGSPNNPSGSVIREEDVIRLLKQDRIVVLDEAYYEFHGESAVKLTSEYKNLVVLRTLSKAFGLGGLRVGYAIADAETAGFISKLKPPFSVSSLSEVAALAALDDVPYMEECVRKIVAGRELLYKELGTTAGGPSYGTFKVYPSKANFLLLDVIPKTADEFYQKMMEQKIIVRKFGRFNGFQGEYVRITVGTEEENKKLLEAVKKL